MMFSFLYVVFYFRYVESGRGNDISNNNKCRVCVPKNLFDTSSQILEKRRYKRKSPYSRNL